MKKMLLKAALNILTVKVKELMSKRGVDAYIQGIVVELLDEVKNEILK